MLSCPVTYCNGNRLFASYVDRLVFQAVLDRELAIISSHQNRDAYENRRSWIRNVHGVKLTYAITLEDLRRASKRLCEQFSI
jgi:hypothetical protein